MGDKQDEEYAKYIMEHMILLFFIVSTMDQEGF